VAIFLIVVSHLNLYPLVLLWPKYHTASLKTNAKKHIVELQKDRDLWKDHCAQIVQGIGPVLDLLDPGLPSAEPRGQQLGVINKCQLAWGWL
jgi:hypothetical protein